MPEAVQQRPLFRIKLVSGQTILAVGKTKVLNPETANEAEGLIFAWMGEERDSFELARRDDGELFAWYMRTNVLAGNDEACYEEISELLGTLAGGNHVMPGERYVLHVKNGLIAESEGGVFSFDVALEEDTKI